MAEQEQGLVKYKARDGQEITLGFKIVREYLVHGKKELVVPNEMMFFMAICKSRGLNPFKKDCYLIKYSTDLAAIVTSIDFYRSRAKAQADCRGWRKGIVLLSKDEKIEEREGTILLKGETLLGGWFRSTPVGWNQEFHHTVNLRSYIKMTKEWKDDKGAVHPARPTQFWAEEKQPDQIMKVAEAQGLRTLWPDEFQNLYSEEEILPGTPDTDTAMKEAEEAGKKEREEAIAKFNESIPNDVHLDDVKVFLELTAKANRESAEAVMVAATATLEAFWAAFRKWEGKQPRREPGQGKPPEKKPEEGVSGAGPSGAGAGSVAPNPPPAERKTASSPPAKEAEDGRLVNCPEDVSGQKFAFYCEKHCAKRKGCPSWPL